MTKDENILYIQCMIVNATAEIEAMKAMNYQRERQGLAQAYDEESFMKVPEQYGLTHNQILAVFHGD